MLHKNLIDQNLIKPKTKLGLLSFLNMIKKWRNDHYKKNKSCQTYCKLY